ncbi:hypothetical protein MMC22_000227 [Lobaria immixta]|nr:hypothetical protein [Lobaria immixta]
MVGSSNTQNIRISYASPGAQPPIFVAGSFTDPPWQPQELEYFLEQPDDNGTGTQSEISQYRFTKNIAVGEGKWQYKFRLGLGGWWVCDERTDKITDESGNENNLLTVKAPLLTSLGPDGVIEDGLLDENNQGTRNQERFKENGISNQKPLLGAGRNEPSRALIFNAESNEVEESDTGLKSQNNKRPSFSYAQYPLDDEISESLEIEEKHARGFNSYQRKAQEELSPFEEKLISEAEGNERQHSLVQGGAEQEGSRRRRTSGKPVSTSSLESSHSPKPSKGGFDRFWERLLEWLYSVLARLFGSERP